MRSRYDYYADSKVLDTDGQTFPDPLINYNTGALSKLPTEYTITSRNLQRFWTCMWEEYSMNDMDDIWLNINGVPYVMDLKPGDVIYKVVPEDLEGYITRKQLGHED